MKTQKSDAAQRWAAVAICGGAMLLGASTALAGPTSALYMSNGNSISVRQGDVFINTWATTSPDEYSLAINSTVRTYSEGNFS